MAAPSPPCCRPILAEECTVDRTFSPLLRRWTPSSTRPREFRRGHVSQRTVGTLLVVSNSPGCPQRLSRLHVVEYLTAEEFVPQPTVETLRIAVLPRTPRRNVHWTDARMTKPRTQACRNELRTVVRPYVLRNPVSNEQASQHIGHILVSDSPRHLQCQTLPRVFIDDRQPLQRRPRTRAVEDEIPRPHMIRALNTMSNASLITVAQSTLLLRLSRHLQPFTAPQSICPIKTNSMPFTLKQLCDPAITESRVLANQLQHP